GERPRVDLRPGHGHGSRGPAGGHGRSDVSIGAVARSARPRVRRRPARYRQGRVQSRELDMSRPGFVLEVDERTPPLLVHEGEGYRLQRFPLGSRVVYPPDPLPGIGDVAGAIRHALLNPLGDTPPLPELLRPGMKLTIAFDDISIPLPPMRTPDIRQRVLEQVVELAARAGVQDLKLIVANSLHRRMTAAEIERAVGERV